MIPDEEILTAELLPAMQRLRREPSLMWIDHGHGTAPFVFDLWAEVNGEPPSTSILKVRERGVCNALEYLGGTLLLLIGHDPVSQEIVTPVGALHRSLVVIHFQNAQPANAYVAELDAELHFLAKPAGMPIEQGWTVTRRPAGHLRFQSPDGKHLYFMGSTPSDYRSVRNARAALRRMGADL